MILTIITITYQAEKYIERTLKSIKIAQEYDKTIKNKVEYIIIDGQSTDGTLDLLSLFSANISTIYSEKDKGLYDAMNKGLRKAQGKYIWFMNAGDEIFSAETLKNILHLLNSDCDVLYGETVFTNDNAGVLGLRSEFTPHILPERLTWKDMALGMVVCHQSIVVKKAIAPFFVENNISADIDWIIKSLKSAKKIIKTDFCISKYLIGGISVKKHRQSLMDRFVVLKNHFGFFPTLFNHFRILIRSLSFLVKNKRKYW